LDMEILSFGIDRAPGDKNPQITHLAFRSISSRPLPLPRS
jgi:hypothetical protein